MNKKTLQALRDWIAQHKENLKAETLEAVKLGPSNCALCKLFLNNDCIGCPVYTRPQLFGCTGTPYGKLIDAYDAWKSAVFFYGAEDCLSERAAFRAAERKEIKFLESLLPEGR